MSESLKVTADDIVKMRTQQIHSAVEYAELAAKSAMPLGGPQAFAENQSTLRENIAWKALANDLDGRITAICYSIATKDRKTAKQQISKYFTDRIQQTNSGTEEGKSRWNADGLALMLVSGFFPKDKKVGELVHEFYVSQRKQNQNGERGD